MHTGSFTCTDGLRQGDSPSPVLFAISINDTSKRVTDIDKDKNMDNRVINNSLLLMAKFSGVSRILFGAGGCLAIILIYVNTYM